MSDADRLEAAIRAAGDALNGAHAAGYIIPADRIGDIREQLELLGRLKKITNSKVLRKWGTFLLYANFASYG